MWVCFTCGFGVETAVLGIAGILATSWEDFLSVFALRERRSDLALTGDTNSSRVTSGVWALPKSKVVASDSMGTCTGESAASLSVGSLRTLSGVLQGAGVSREDTKWSLVTSGVFTAEKSKLVMLTEVLELQLTDDMAGE